MNEAKRGHRMVVSGGKILCHGGISNGTQLATTEIFENEVWTKKADSPVTFIK